MLLRTLLTGILLTAGAFAQVSSFPKPSYFRETFQKTRTNVELKDPVKLKDFVADGKLELSLKHYLELVMANNTDIQIQFLTVEIPKNNIQAAMGVWDPTATTRFSTTRTTSLPTSPLDANNVNAILKSLNQPYSLSYQQTLDTGTQLHGDVLRREELEQRLAVELPQAAHGEPRDSTSTSRCCAIAAGS